jgi:hypothetical protein
MRFKTRKAAGVATAAAALIWATGSMAGASVSTDGYYYNAGDTVQITGDQMTAGENVTVDVDLPDGSLSQEHVVVADSNGGFADSYTLALDAPAGIYSVVATGQSSGNVFTTTFDPFKLTITLSPASLTVGDSTTISGNLSNNGTSSVDNRTVTVLLYATSNCTGASTLIGTATTDVNGDWSLPSYSPPVGTWYVGASVPQAQASVCSNSLVVDSGNTSGGPTADAGGTYNGDEGSAIHLDGSGSTGAASYAWSVSSLSAAGDDTPGNVGGPACTFDDATSATPQLTCNDDSDSGVFEVTLQVTDANSQTNSDTADVTVSNVVPVVADSSTWTVTPSNCSVNVAAGFSDAGLNDTHIATITWGDTTQSPGTVTEETSTTSGSVSGSHTYSAPGSYSISVTVTDDDNGVGNTTTPYVLNNNPTVNYPLPPIMTGKSFNTGSTIPVKVSVMGCTSGLHPTISVNPAVTTVKSSGKSNLLDQLRYTPDLPGFIYNWSTKGWTAQNYIVTINGLPSSPITAPVTLTK